MDNTCHKLDDIVEFDHQLKVTLKTMSSSSSLKHASQQQDGSCEMDAPQAVESHSNHDQGNDALVKSAAQESELMYELQSVICHVGESSSGHYTAYARHPETKEWFYFNDSCVSRELPRTKDPRAYILFYAHVPQAPAS